jgi:solute carrier family 25 protein 34/35
VAALQHLPLQVVFCGRLQSTTDKIQVTVSNPAEVAKTRLQLQGELAKAGTEKVYKNAFDVIGKTYKNEGIRGMQRGLGPAARRPVFVSRRSLTRPSVRIPSMSFVISFGGIFGNHPSRYC